MFHFPPSRDGERNTGKKASKGLTLIELVISISIVAVIIAASVSLFAFGSKSFTDGTSKAENQRNVRLVADYITDLVRRCENFGVSNGSVTLDSAKYQKGIGITGGNFTAFKLQPLSNILSTEAIEDITFYIFDKSGKAMLHFTVTGSSGNGSFVMERDVLFNNISTAQFQKKITENDPTKILLESGNTYSLKTYKIYYGNNP